LDRVATLSALDRRMLQEFSRRTIARLREALPLRIVLPRLEPFLAYNLEKEIRKDRAMIERAAAAAAAGASPAAEAASEVLAEMKRIDREFLHEVRWFPVRIDVPYASIDPLRRQRVELGLELAFRVMRAWRGGRKMRSAFSKRELEARLQSLLELYARETQALARCVRLPAPLEPLRERLARALLEAMKAVAHSVTREAGTAICGSES
jgi:hypothetical protein